MDLNVTAFRIVKQLTTENKEEKPVSTARRAAGRIGGPARAAKLTPEQRKEIAVKANKARWQKRTNKTHE
jgi:hypothetical protein